MAPQVIPIFSHDKFFEIVCTSLGSNQAVDQTAKGIESRGF